MLMLPTHALALSEKVPTSMESVRLEPTKLILVGTRTTYSTKPAACTRGALNRSPKVPVPGTMVLALHYKALHHV